LRLGAANNAQNGGAFSIMLQRSGKALDYYDPTIT
jgi:hypothetical protein